MVTSSCRSQLGTSREFFTVQSNLPTPLGSTRISWHSLCTFSLLMVAWGLSNRYSCIRQREEKWRACTLGTRTRTLCSPFDVVDNLSCGGGRFESWYAFEKIPTAVLGRSSTLLNPAHFKVGIPFFMAFSPVPTQQIPELAQCLQRDFLIFSIRVLHSLMDRVAIAQLILSGTITVESFWSIFSAHVTDTFWLCNNFANRDQKSWREGWWRTFGDASVTIAQWRRARDLRKFGVICKSPVRFRPKPRQININLSNPQARVLNYC